MRASEVGAHADRFDASALRKRRELRLIGPAMTSHASRQASAAPRNPGDRPLCAGQEPVAGRGQGPQAFVQRIAAWARRRRRSRPCARWPTSLELYPDGASTALREAIGRRYGLDPARIICGNGSDELLALLAHVFLHPGDEGLYSQYGFLTYPICIRAAGGVPVVAEETDRTASVDAILAKVSARTKIVYLANPNNPTGTYIPFSEVKRLHAGLPPHALLVIDAAYAEYVTRNDYAAGLELASSADNVVMTRTFSKIHGLAGLRIGWAYGSAHVIDALNRVRGPFNLNGAAQAAGVASLDDARAYRRRDRAQRALAALARRGRSPSSGSR